MADKDNINEAAARMADNAKPARLHKATYSRDKKKGGYLVRVAGPNAGAFAGRKVPVTLNNQTEHEEELLALVWTGADDGQYGGVAGTPVALYTFKATPREEDEAMPF